ncbi:MAG: class I tRNA ligase family protein, partial [Eubacteriales bacterium]|nr:class I tRNA ligase family protein [Eubacteriales bacterium]
HGMILGENGEKMSKSKGNVINPDDIIAEYGSDTLRLYEMFIGDFEKSAPWSPSSIRGCKRFLDRTASLTDLVSGSGVTPKLENAFHKTIKKVTEDIDDMKFNTAIASMMTLLNQIYDNGALTVDELKVFITLLNPFAPHLTEEMWEYLDGGGFLSTADWPDYDIEKTQDEIVEIAIQINGKLRGTVTVPADMPKEQVLVLAKDVENVKSYIKDKSIIKEIYIVNKIVNIVVK